nr:hypothetical protein Itr_chr03CG08590 [Ipomoea trifida]
MSFGERLSGVDSRVGAVHRLPRPRTRRKDSCTAACFLLGHLVPANKVHIKKMEIESFRYRTTVTPLASSVLGSRKLQSKSPRLFQCSNQFSPQSHFTFSILKSRVFTVAISAISKGL